MASRLVGFGGVGHDEQRRHRPVPSGGHDRASLRFLGLAAFLEVGRERQPPVSQEGGPSGHDGSTRHHPLDAQARSIGEALDRGQRRGRRPCRARGDRPGDRMLRSSLERAHEAQRLRPVDPLGGHDAQQAHRARGHGPGLVEDDRVDLAGRLQHLRTIDENAELGAPPGADHQGRGRGQPERARAGDDQHGHRSREGAGHVAGGDQPEREDGGRQDENDRDEDGRHSIRQPLDGRLPGLRPLDQPGHLGELGVAPDPGRPHHQAPTGVDRGSDDPVARADLDRHALPRQHRLVDRRRAVLDHAIRGDLLPGPDNEAIAHDELCDRNASLVPVRVQPRRRPWPRARAVPAGPPRPAAWRAPPGIGP